MLTEHELRLQVRDALEAVTPPAPWLASTITDSLATERRGSWRYWSPRRLRIVMRPVAVMLLIVLALAVVATFLEARNSRTRALPAGPSSYTFSWGWWWLGEVAMVSPTDGWQYGGPIKHTSDGGVHWSDVTPPGVGQYFENDYLDATHAWVTDWSGGCALVDSLPPCAVPLKLTTYRTSNGGRTWQRGSPTPITVDSVGIAHHQFYFVDPDHGWLLLSKLVRTSNGIPVYSDNLYQTSDGGLHWAIEAVHTAPPAWSSDKFSCFEWCGPMTFASTTTGWLSMYGASDAAQAALLVTHDGGVTWRPQTLPQSARVTCPCLGGPVAVFDELNAMFELYSPVAEKVTLFVTSDGGNTWMARALPGAAQSDVGFYDFKHGWLLEQSLRVLGQWSPKSPTIPLSLYRTDDGGSTWTPVPTNLQLQSKDGQVRSLYFIDQEIGFAVRVNGTPQSPAGCDLLSMDCNPVRALLKTTDGGHTWSVVNANV